MTRNQLNAGDTGEFDVDRRRWRAVVSALVLGAIVVGALGALYGSTRAPNHSAQTALSVLPDSAVSADQNAPAVDATSFVQGQLVVLNGAQLASQVQKQLSLASLPSLSSKQVGQSYVVQVRATAGSSSQAASIATAAASSYAKQRSQQLRTAISSSITSTNQQLKSVSASLTAAAKLAPTTGATTPAENALQTEYQRLLTVNSGLQLSLTQVNKVVTVLSPASVDGSSLSATTKDGLAGALLGAILGIAAVIGYRRAVPRLRSVADVDALGVEVVLPVLARGVRGRSRVNAGRLLAARVARHEGPSPAPLVVVGATSGVGASFVAASIAAGLAERGRVLLIVADDRDIDAIEPNQVEAYPRWADELIATAQRSTVHGVWVLQFGIPAVGTSAVDRRALLAEILRQAAGHGYLVVVDTACLAQSSLALELAQAGAEVALVIGQGVSRAGEVLGAVDVLDSNAVVCAGVILNEVPMRFGRGRSAPYTVAGGPPRQPESRSVEAALAASRAAASTGRQARRSQNEPVEAKRPGYEEAS
jgi:Mrp family chromosome partitioning ATPase